MVVVDKVIRESGDRSVYVVRLHRPPAGLDGGASSISDCKPRSPGFGPAASRPSYRLPPPCPIMNTASLAVYSDSASASPCGRRCVTRGSEHPTQCKACIGVVEHQVGVRCDRNRLPGLRDSRLMLSLRRKDLGPHRPPRDGGLQVVAGDPLAFGGVPIGFVDASLRQNGSRQQGSGLAGIGAHPQRVEPLKRGSEMRFGRDRVTHHHFDDSGEEFGLHQAVPEAEIGHHLTGIGKHRPRLVRPATQQFQHREAAQRGGLQ